MTQNKQKKLTATKIITLSFAIVIFSGAFLLSLPLSSKAGQFTPFVDSLFTATSATCVTGLVVYDTFTHFSNFGQGVILLLIQIGGLGLMTFTTFFSVAIGHRLSFKSVQLAQESISLTNIVNITKTIKMVIAFAFTVEAIGALILMTTFVPKYGLQGIWISIFLSISGFCNAGFDILGFETQFASLTNYTGDPVVVITISLLIIIGGLGFVVWNDLYHFRKTKRLLLHTKVVLLMTGLLIALGTVSITLLEWNNPETMGNLSWLEKIGGGFFQSVSCRTAGFNTIPTNTLTGLTKLVMSILMFIGAGPGSTAGGIKVTTICVIFLTVASVVKSRQDTMIGKRKINKQTVYKAISVFFLSLLILMVACTAILLLNPNFTEIDVLFEVTSGLATVGYSVGISSSTGILSKLILSSVMFIGRVGIIALLMSIVPSEPKKAEIVPEGTLLI